MSNLISKLAKILLVTILWICSVVGANGLFTKVTQAQNWTEIQQIAYGDEERVMELCKTAVTSDAFIINFMPQHPGYLKALAKCRYQMFPLLRAEK